MKQATGVKAGSAPSSGDEQGRGLGAMVVLRGGMVRRREAGRGTTMAGRAVASFLAAPAQASDGVIILRLSGVGMRVPDHGVVLVVLSFVILVLDVLFGNPAFLSGMCGGCICGDAWTTWIGTPG